MCVCEVSDGESIFLVVCGVFNVCEGLKVLFVRVGVLLFGDFKIKKVKLCGEFFEGMLCGGFELGFEDCIDGLLELLEDVLVGIDICDYLFLNDIVIEVDLIFNWVDCLSLCGIVREVGVFNCILFNEFVIELVFVILDDCFLVILDDSDGCLCYLGWVICGINVVVEMLLWMVECLCCVGVCVIDLIVDVINYVLLELG